MFYNPGERGLNLVIICDKNECLLTLSSLVDNFCCLLITIANSLDLGQARQNVGPDLDPNCLTLMVFSKEIFEKVSFEKNQQTATKA